MTDQPHGTLHTATDMARIKQRARMQQMAEAGFTITRTAQALGTSRASVLRFAKRSGIAFRQRTCDPRADDALPPICSNDDMPVLDVDDCREAIQDMKPLDAVDHLLGLLDGLTHQLPEMSLTPLPGLVLTRLEARMLHHLDRYRNRPVSDEALMFAMYQLRQDRDWPDTSILSVRVCHIRQKLALAGLAEIRIETCRTFGYCLRVNESVRLRWRGITGDGAGA